MKSFSEYIMEEEELYEAKLIPAVINADGSKTIGHEG